MLIKHKPTYLPSHTHAHTFRTQYIYVYLVILNSFMLSSFILQENIQGHCKYALIRNNSVDDYTSDTFVCPDIFIVFYWYVRVWCVFTYFWSTLSPLCLRVLFDHTTQLIHYSILNYRSVVTQVMIISFYFRASAKSALNREVSYWSTRSIGFNIVFGGSDQTPQFKDGLVLRKDSIVRTIFITQIFT